MLKEAFFELISVSFIMNLNTEIAKKSTNNLFLFKFFKDRDLTLGKRTKKLIVLNVLYFLGALI